jgi:hypothetical protein
VIADLSRVRLEPERSRIIVSEFLGVEKRLERRLRVDDDLFAARQMDHEIGLSRPLSLRSGGCSSKSQRGSMPAISTTRRSCISPHRPRTAGVRNARDNLSALDPSTLTFSASRAYASSRSRSASASLPSTFLSVSVIG